MSSVSMHPALCLLSLLDMPRLKPKQDSSVPPHAFPYGFHHFSNPTHPYSLTLSQFHPHFHLSYCSSFAVNFLFSFLSTSYCMKAYLLQIEISWTHSTNLNI